MNEYLDDLFLRYLNIEVSEQKKNVSLFELGNMIDVEKILLIIILFAKRYNICVDYFDKEIKICSYNEILGIGESYGNNTMNC